MSTRRSILIVDDEPLNLLLIGEYLKVAEQYFTWDTADNGRLAWEKLQADPNAYDVILLDRMMPEMNGLEVLANILQHPVLCQVPVIIQSARASITDVEEVSSTGVVYYLTKPFSESELIDALNTALQKSPRNISEEAKHGQ